MIKQVFEFIQTLEPKDFISIIGILATFFVSLATLIYSRKQRFISSITKMRCEYLNDIKKYIAGFISECSKVINNKQNNVSVDYEKLHETYSLILLNISKTHWFDINYEQYLSKIYGLMLTEFPSLAVLEMEKLIDLSRKLIKMEWEGIKYETMHGHPANGKNKKKLEDKWLR